MTDTTINGAGAILAEAGFETLTDDMITRLARAAGDGLTLLDGVREHKTAEALAVLGTMVSSGDLARLAHLARLVGAAEDALTDDLVARIAHLASDAMTLLDRVGRLDIAHYERLGRRLEESLSPDLFERVLKALPVALDLFEQAAASGLLRDVCAGLAATREELAKTEAPGGGLGGLWTLMKDPGHQRTLQGLLLYARRILGSGV